MVVAEVHREVEMQLANKEVVKSLVETTFKGLKPDVMKQAMVEGMLRGFKFKDFLEKQVYAVPFGEGYALVTSIDRFRRIAAQHGQVGKGEPVFETTPDGGIVACSVTVKRKVGADIADFTAKVYFAEYRSKKPIWESKPRTMIAKVAEAHALRMAFPEELSQEYVSEEFDQKEKPATEAPKVDVESYKKRLEGVESYDELLKVWSALPIEAKNALVEVKDELKKKFPAPAAEPAK